MMDSLIKLTAAKNIITEHILYLNFATKIKYKYSDYLEIGMVHINFICFIFFPINPQEEIQSDKQSICE